MISNEKRVLIQQEFEQSNRLETFVLKYQNIEDEGVQYLIALAYWHIMQQEIETENKINQCKRFIRTYTDAKDLRIRQLLITAHDYILAQNSEQLEQQYNEQYNTIIELSQSLENLDENTSEIVINAYWHKIAQLKNKDGFKTEYFYHRIMTLSANLSELKQLHHYFRVTVEKLLWALQNNKDITTNIEALFSEFPQIGDDFINQYRLGLIQKYLKYIAFIHGDQLAKQLDILNKVIHTEQFKDAINKSNEFHQIGEILQYLTYLFWVDDRLKQVEKLAHIYFQFTQFTLDQIIERNFAFPISEHIDIDAFNQFLCLQYDQFTYLQKYRKLFKVPNKNMFFLNN